MATQPIPVLKETFSDNKEPNGQDFGNLIDSFEHKSIPIEQTRIRGLAQSFDKKADKDQLSAIIDGIVRQPAVDTYNDTSGGKTSLLATYPNPEIGWDVLVRDENTRYSWNGEKWVDLETGVYNDEDLIKKDDLAQDIGDDSEKAISQAGVKNTILDIDGIVFGEGGSGGGSNIFDSSDIVSGQYLNGKTSGAATGAAGVSYNRAYVSVKANKTMSLFKFC